MSAPTDLSNEERIQYWADRSPDEKFAAAWKMTVAHYKAVGLYVEGQAMDKSIARLGTLAEAKDANDT